jgi:hypothetical protein
LIYIAIFLAVFLIDFPLGFFVSARTTNVLILGPFFLVPLMIGAAVGWKGPMVRWVKYPQWVWILGTLFLIGYAVSAESTYRPLGELLSSDCGSISSDCGSSECLNELFISAPLAGSIAFAVSRVINDRRRLARTHSAG